ncbi:MAG: hypothetical protein N2Z69_06645 [Methylophilaceae bacterium]|nr:hypothetical protein [Methylophilaceae bacterium]
MGWRVLLASAGLGVMSWALAQDAALQAAFERRYQDYLHAASQALLPFPQVGKTDWKRLKETHPLQVVFVAPDRYYNGKVYTLTLYQAEDGRYYLEAKGGFWGMDELAYGPLGPDELK